MDPYDVAYRGDALLSYGDDVVPVVVVLTGHWEPLDGKYHWYGRIDGDERVRALKDRAPRGAVKIALPDGSPVAGRLSEVDPHGNVRVEGAGTPPYPMETLEEIEAE